MTDKRNDVESTISGDELSLGEIREFFKIFKGLWKRSLIYVLLPVIIFGFIGFLAAITSPTEYDAKCVLISDQSSNPSNVAGGLQGLASLAGVSVPAGGSDPMGAELYPMIISNKPFLIELSKTPIYVINGEKAETFESYFKREIRPDLITRILNAIRHPSDIKKLFGKSKSTGAIFPAKLINNDTAKLKETELFFSNQAYISELTAEDKNIIGILTDRIKFTQSGKLITLSVKMPEARLSAEATKTVLNLMIKYAIKFKTGKQLENLRFLQERTAETEIKYKECQQRLAGFKDNNYHVIYESVQSKELQLQNEFSLAFSVYNQFVTQLEQARIQLKKDSPLFTVVEPVYIPAAISADANKQIISYASSGIFIGIVLVMFLFVKTYYRHLKKQPSR